MRTTPHSQHSTMPSNTGESSEASHRCYPDAGSGYVDGAEPVEDLGQPLTGGKRMRYPMLLPFAVAVSGLAPADPMGRATGEPLPPCHGERAVAL
jgi:hypothetical protein